MTKNYLLKYIGISCIFGIFYAINNALTPWLQLVPGAHLIHIPSGIKLVLVLIFEIAGALSIFTVSLIAGLFFFFPNQPLVCLELAIANAVAPYLTVAILTSKDGIDGWIRTLRRDKIILLALLYSGLNSALNQLIFYWNNITNDIVSGLTIMLAGDLTGVFITLLILKWIGRFTEK